MDTRPGETLPVTWSDLADDVINGDLTVAVAYITPAGGAVVSALAPLGLGDRAAGVLGFTTALGLHKKLERILRDPKVALAYHARQYGLSDSPLYVLAQGISSVDLTPSRERLEAVIPAAQKFLGGVRTGWFWDRLLHEYYWERVFVDVRVTRLTTWGTLDAQGTPEVTGTPQSDPPPSQTPPRNGTEPRIDMRRSANQVVKLPHRVLAYRGADGFPVIVPVRVEAHGSRGFRLGATPGLLPPGARRAGFLAHAYHPRLVGISTRSMTGWLEIAEDGTGIYAPHTSKGWTAPPMKTAVLVANGLLAKYGYKKAIRNGALEELQAIQAEQRT